ncbi:MAG: methylenetetrahydrofolate reductase [NAD(P)H] [Meiothermus sp.]|uniref:methylenetetrahydrofolate reductase [NAD(P)H] n=1 Tax=Meiothermus sp. TaxID=1955249 RepID=UPI0025E085C0|nr:methylenetetrahydrofolate reductase [NAD(P)H] [Meiothermus sp.]MCS7057718.1 methylenetetrahydrofolate reductase [NAD(P)H] [Meiothermus sp.]MCS7193385.1 methylenetetrahydrofolate reductase [NAD(P)H] [Meiothermus sp.]MCX7739806.1 methylenetetrahydrofolate reductase [NAD(P)H] [Meiothermus sp.]MDW8090898.1 methylenetetrahydrofolate reductase [NAD(P)H] [Meiothermus sp.]MDW8482036.1 methylenetetrahydrofolate reductase [NAD(P)H] [Meiothermus sp.]
MKISALFRQNRPLFSFEFFPPKTPQGEASLFRTLHELKPLRPAFVSITYGAGGSERRKTTEWAARIQREVGLTAMAHLTCVGHTREELRSILQGYAEAGIQNVMALRGDPPRGAKDFQPVEGGFRYASELVAFIREEFGNTFTLAGGAYPEGHPEAVSLEADLLHLKRKVDAGLDFLVTQLFFNNALYFGFLERARRVGIEVPILPGLMPITDLAQIRRFMDMCGASIPGPLLSRLERAQTPEEVLEIGVEHTTRQAQELLEAGVPGLHLYTLNKSPATRRVMENLQWVLR